MKKHRQSEGMYCRYRLQRGLYAYGLTLRRSHSPYLLPLRSSSSKVENTKQSKFFTCKERTSWAFDILLILGHYNTVLAAMWIQQGRRIRRNSSSWSLAVMVIVNPAPQAASKTAIETYHSIFDLCKGYFHQIRDRFLRFNRSDFECSKGNPCRNVPWEGVSRSCKFDQN